MLPDISLHIRASTLKSEMRDERCGREKNNCGVFSLFLTARRSRGPLSWKVVLVLGDISTFNICHYKLVALKSQNHFWSNLNYLDTCQLWSILICYLSTNPFLAVMHWKGFSVLFFLTSKYLARNFKLRCWLENCSILQMLPLTLSNCVVSLRSTTKNILR